MTGKKIRAASAAAQLIGVLLMTCLLPLADDHERPGPRKRALFDRQRLTGMKPLPPKPIENVVPVVVCRMNHSPDEAWYTAWSALPSPSKSRGTAVKPGPPNPSENVPPVDDCRMNHSPDAWWYTAMSTFPSPA